MEVGTGNQQHAGSVGRGIVEEKEGGVRDLLLIHGLQPWVLHCAWAATYLAIFALVSVAVTVVCTATFLHRTPPSMLLVGPPAHGTRHKIPKITHSAFTKSHTEHSLSKLFQRCAGAFQDVQQMIKQTAIKFAS